MIARARVHETLFRRGSKGREAMAPPGEGGSHVHYQAAKSVGVGCKTSRPHPEITFWELLAWQLSGEGDPTRAAVPGCTVAMAKQMYHQGLIK